MATFVDPPWVRAARASQLWSVVVNQTTSFATPDGNGYYAFSDGTSGILSYTVPSAKTSFLSWLSVRPGLSTSRAIVAFYLGATIQNLRLPITGDGLYVDLTNVVGLGSASIGSGTVIELRIIPSAVGDDYVAAFGGFNE